jgi:Fe-Mn family superoxide dismutase
MQTTRRQALKTLTAVAVASTALGRISSFAQTPTAAPAPAAAPAPPKGPFTLPPLPYAYDALEPSIDAETMHLHHDKHHASYVNKLNEALAKEPSFGVAPGSNVDELLKNLSSVPESIRLAVRNQGGGHSNHSLFWQTLAPHHVPAENLEKMLPGPQGALADATNAQIGDYEKLKTEMAKNGAGVFGSGWSWLVLNKDKKLALVASPNQDSPIMDGNYPLFGIDVWEHAYYLKYHNLRADYITAIWNVVNWDFISKRYDAAMAA